MGSLRGYLISAVIVAAIAGFIYWKGGENARDAVERQNDKAGHAAEKASSDLAACRDSGGVFDFSTGKCRRPEGRSWWPPSWGSGED